MRDMLAFLYHLQRYENFFKCDRLTESKNSFILCALWVKYLISTEDNYKLSMDTTGKAVYEIK